MAERPQFFTVLPTSPSKLVVVNGRRRAKTPVLPDVLQTRVMSRRTGLDLMSREILATMAFKRGRMRQKGKLMPNIHPSRTMTDISNETNSAKNIDMLSSPTSTLSLPLNENGQDSNSDLLDSVMKPIIQISSFEKPTTDLPMLPHTFLDDNPTPKDQQDANDSTSTSIAELPAIDSPPTSAPFPPFTGDVEEITRAPPKVSVLNHQKRHQSTVPMTAPAATSLQPARRKNSIINPIDESTKEAKIMMDMDEIDKKRAEMNMPPLSVGYEDSEQVEIKLLKKFVNRSRVLKKYMNPSVLSREMPRRNSLFHVMDNSSSIQNFGDDSDPPSTPPMGRALQRMLLSRGRGGGKAGDGFHPHSLEATPESFGRSNRNIVSLEARYKDVHNLNRDGMIPEEDDENHKNSTNLFQKFCHHIVIKQRKKYMARVKMNIINEIDLPDTPNDKETKKRTPNGRRQDREAAKHYLTGVDAVLTIDELYDEALVAERNRQWRRATMLASACVSMDKEWMEPLLLRARLCRRLGLWTQTLKDLTACLRLNPNNQRVLLQRAYVHTQLLDYHSALVDLSNVLNQQPNSAEALLLRSKIYAQQNHTTMALKDLTAVVKNDPKNWRAYYERANMRHKMIENMGEESKEKQFDETSAVGNIQSLIVLTIEDYLNAIRSGCFLNDLIETIGDLTIRLVEWTHDAKHCVQTIGSLGSIVQLMEESEGKIKEQRRTHPQGNERKWEVEEDRIARIQVCLLTQRGRLYIMIGQYSMASTDLDRAVIMDYHYAPAHFYRGAVASMNAIDETSRKAVLQHLNRSIHLDPTITGAYIVRGGLYCAELRFNNALQDFKAAVTVDPTLDDIWIQIAIVFLTHYHDCEACAKACTRALKNDLGLTQALHLRGEALSRQGNHKAALRDFIRLVMMRPADRFAHLMKGKSLLQLEQVRPALYGYMLFMEMGNEQSTVDRITRGKAYKVLSQHSKAVQEFKLAVDVNPTPENLCLLSESLHSMGDTEASLHVINMAIESDPLCARSYARRAQCYIGSHAYKTAILDYDYAITLADKLDLYRMYFERALCRTQLLFKAWNQLYSLQRGERIPCYYENNFKPGAPIPETLETNEMNTANMTAFIKQTYTDTLNDFTKCMKSSETMAEPYVERAALYTLGGEYNLAYADLATAVELDPTNIAAYINAGLLKSKFSMYTSSIECYDQALKHHPNSALAYYNRGVAYHTLNVWAQADSDYTKCICIDATNVDALRNRGIARCHLRNFKGAASDFEEVYKGAPDDMELTTYGNNPTAIDAYLDAGNTFFTMALYISDTSSSTSHSSKQESFKSLLQQALVCYIRAMRINPTDVKIRLNIAALFRARKDNLNAGRQYKVVAVLDPKNQEYHDEMAMMLYEKGKLEDAIHHMNAAIDISVSLSPIVEMEYALLVKDKSTALQELHRRRLHQDKILPRTPGPSNAFLSKEGRRRRMSVTADVLADKKSIMGIKKTLAIHLSNRGKVFERMNRIDDAKEDYLHAVYFDPLSYDVYFHLGTLALQERNLEESVDYFSQALVINPKLGVAQLNLGVATMLLKNYNIAAHHLDQAAMLIPDCAFVWANKACNELCMGNRTEEALHHLTQAMRCMPTFAPFYVFRGRLLSSQKHLHDAMVDFAAALKMGYADNL